MPLYYLLYLWFLFSSKVEVNKIARANQLIADAEESFKSGQYVLALVKYRYLINSMQIRDNRIQLNLAHCYYLNKDIQQAQKYYEQVVQSPNPTISSVALQQLGVIAFEKKQYKKSLEYFKKSLRTYPANEDSRYNYELVARLFPATDAVSEDKKETQKAEKAPPPPPPDSEDRITQSESQSNEGSEQKNTESQQQEQIKRKLRQINLTEEKARMILDAMKNNEIQYIQQTKKQASGPEEKNQPDW